ncbi:hypothetical protein [Loktanella sp. SALINAS62]|uniref:hypothetical protein n=1 Tax=Loktanella sp. SALINAS62 TaxID=2706124 RepID=UPI001B8CE47E|nr:hypothetical protein [Loktanella sp. SALINAS62]MBS1303497.1 hypothetical protein [Loktanella sp. SALINAS62]
MFRFLIMFSAGLCLCLSAVLMFAPGAYVGLYLDGAAPGGAFMGRRAAPVLFGVAIIVFTLRDVPAGTHRRTVALAMAAMWGGIGLTGLWENGVGQANANAMIAALFELMLAVAFVRAR